MPTRMVMMDITTTSSISEKAQRKRVDMGWGVFMAGSPDKPTSHANYYIVMGRAQGAAEGGWAGRGVREAAVWARVTV